jgi:hypothetical protein
MHLPKPDTLTMTNETEGETRICIPDESGNILSMRLSDFIHDIDACPQGLARENISSTV